MSAKAYELVLSDGDTIDPVKSIAVRGAAVWVSNGVHEYEHAIGQSITLTIRPLAGQPEQPHD